MKGRRQPRRAALQGLYELDLSQHPLELVLAGRVESLCETTFDSLLPADLRPAARTALVDWSGQPLTDADAPRIAQAVGVDLTAALTLIRVLNQLAPQVAYLSELMRGVANAAEQLDAVIHTIAPEWPVVQMAPVDRNVLRIALWELATGASPTRVAINEAVELARTFSGEGARRMVNGALGTFVSSGQPLVLGQGASPALPRP
jgi:N utilization substance protein B